ncbi:hypothetical protein B0O99DRAFT_649625 [Bisporella sp. PMI_857]|nr:hypothetical protein B0O99DRAFT_649625 [Bisporella sp. PMI_857]
MADNGPPPSSAQLPPPAAGICRCTRLENGHNGNPHMPPPPSSSGHLPQNTNRFLLPLHRPWEKIRGSPNKRALYVGGLDPRVTEDNVKIIPDKNVGAFQSKGFNYGFVEYDDPGAAERAMQTLNGRRPSGDLSNEVNDEVLLQAFSAFGSVLADRGYGFVAFRERQDAEKALSSMDGEWLGSRAIRCNWANQKGQPSISQQQAMSAMGMTPTTPFGHHHFPTHADRGFAFVKMDTHENAAMAICQLSGYNVNGRPLKCSGKDKAPNADGTSGVGIGYSPAAGGATPGGYAGTPSAYFPQYGGQQGGYGGPPAQSPGQYPNQADGYGGPASAGGYGRGAQQPPNAQWSAPATQNYQNGFGGYRGNEYLLTSSFSSCDKICDLFVEWDMNSGTIFS